MSLLLITLPAGLPGPACSYPYATSVDGQSLAAHGDAGAALLPPAGRGVEVVAVAPAARLSWRRVTLPQGVGPTSPRLRAVLTGLLEDQLLDDAGQLHFALEPGAAAGGAAWVAVCERDWLAAHLNALDAAQRPVNRIVPELYPRTGTPRLSITGQPDQPWLLMSGERVPGGAQALPLTPGALALLDDGGGAASAPELTAEPAVAALAEQLLGQRVTIEQPARRMLAASRAPWDLAQFELVRTGGARAARRAAALWRDFVHAPVWRPARWGVALLLLINLAGLNLLAWRTQQELGARRAHIDAMLTETFPQVRAVVDAPLQMAREVAALRQAGGASSARDMEQMLAAFGAAAPAQSAPTAIEFTAGELRLKGVELNAELLAESSQRLRPLGYRLQTGADGLLLRQEDAP